jgi:catechol 2,3-dioxygenase-like lactoylglutathione lyase family enzyme
MIQYNGVNHLAMATGDMDKTIRFWRDLLGMRLVAGLGRSGYRHYFSRSLIMTLSPFLSGRGLSPYYRKSTGGQ